MSSPVVAAVLSCSNLSKVYQEAQLRTPVLNGVDLTVSEGETVSIMGTSGSGKSTLLHILGGLDLPSSGEVFVQGQAMSKLSETARGQLRNRAMGFIYQFHHLLPEFTALENVAMPLLISGMSIKDAYAQSSELLEKVGLAKRLQHKPGELSGGERQRCAVARALVTKPACVLADEPTGNLDAYNAAQVFDLMLALNQEFKTSLVLVTHDRSLAGKAQRMLELREGTLHSLM